MSNRPEGTGSSDGIIKRFRPSDGNRGRSDNTDWNRQSSWDQRDRYQHPSQSYQHNQGHRYSQGSGNQGYGNTRHSDGHSHQRMDKRENVVWTGKKVDHSASQSRASSRLDTSCWNEDLVRAMKPVWQYTGFDCAVNNLLQTVSGGSVLASTSSGDLSLISLTDLRLTKTFSSHRHGIGQMAILTEENSDPSEVLVSCAKDALAVDFNVRLWNLAGNRISRLFGGHSQPVTGIYPFVFDQASDATSSLDCRSFSTTASDGTIRLWDTRSSASTACFKFSRKSESPVLTTVSSEVVAIAANETANSILLCDRRHLSNSNCLPTGQASVKYFAEIPIGVSSELETANHSPWSIGSMSCSSNGSMLLVSRSDGVQALTRVVDLHNNTSVGTHKHAAHSGQSADKPSLSPDGKFISIPFRADNLASGFEVRKSDSGDVIRQFSCHKPIVPQVAFSTKYAALISAGIGVTVWHPTS